MRSRPVWLSSAYTAYAYRYAGCSRLHLKPHYAEQAGISIHIRVLRKGVQAAVGKQLDGKGDFLRLRLVLFQKLRPEILQGRHFALIVILLIGAVHAGGAAVDNGFLLCAEVIIMLNQASTDRLELAKLLNISDLQMSYITNVEAGHGLIKVGSSLVPFANKFPKNTKLYKLMTTKPGESA